MAYVNNYVDFKVTYFKLYARGEAIRMLLSHAGANWEDNQIEFSEWPALKPHVPGNALPCLELKANGKKMGQSVAILRFLAMQYGYYPSDPLLAHKANELIDGLTDVFGKINAPAFNKDYDTGPIFSTVIPNFLSVIEKHLSTQDGKQYIVGGKMSIADFAIGGFYCNFFANPEMYKPEEWAKVLKQYPNFQEYGLNYSTEMETYLAARGSYKI